ncbi:MAG: metal ABC transporter permease [Solirubrobacteraceae bacterium]|jgi:manganese/zinc/iron transport system permease protein|nr:metal ABC transporter permease [Solirubrobacteraceae bacterium]
MSDGLVIVLTAGLVGTACGLLGPFLVLRGVALMGDAVAHAVLPGIVAVFLLFGTRSPPAMIAGAAVFAVVCVLAIDALRRTGLVRADAAIGLVFPALFALGVLGIQRWGDDLHLDLDSTIYGEIAFAPFRTAEVLGVEVPTSLLVLAPVALFNLALVLVLWKELKATSFDPGFSRVAGIPPGLVSNLLLIAVAITAVSAFESVGAILVVALLIVPAATAHLLADRLWLMVVLSVAFGWVAAVAGYVGAEAVDASIAGAMGLAAAIGFVTALVVAPRHGLLARRAAPAPRAS